MGGKGGGGGGGVAHHRPTCCPFAFRLTAPTPHPPPPHSHPVVLRDCPPYIQLYVDGAVTNFGPVPQPVLSTRSKMWFGVASDALSRLAIPQRFDGMLDEVRIWTVARSQVDLIANRVTMKPGPFPSTLGAYFDFDSDTPTVLSVGTDNITLSMATDVTLYNRVARMQCLHTTSCRANVSSGVAVCGDSRRTVPFEQVR
jgi:hypothetical protein